jgi:hypothetical protein
VLLKVRPDLGLDLLVELDQLDEKWSVDGPALLDKIAASATPTATNSSPFRSEPARISLPTMNPWLAH